MAYAMRRFGCVSWGEATVDGNEKMMTGWLMVKGGWDFFKDFVVDIC